MDNFVPHADVANLAKPRGRRTLYAMRTWHKLAAAAVIVFLGGCGGGTSPSAIPPVPPPTGDSVLTQADVQSIVLATAATVNQPLVIAISDRRGVILAIYANANAPATVAGNFGEMLPVQDVAAGLARTAAYFSNDQAPIGSRTVRFLSGIHFPPGVSDTEAAPLYGIENTNRGCNFNVTYLPGQSIPILSSITGVPFGPGMLTGKPNVTDSSPEPLNPILNPGGVPIFKNNTVAGGIGVAGSDPATVEYAAVAGISSAGIANVSFVLNPLPPPGAVVVNGVTLPFVNQTTLPAGDQPGPAPGSSSFISGPIAGTGVAPEEDLIAETGSTQGGLALADVQSIVQLAVATANQTRAAIRLPPGVRAHFVISVADLDGHLLALYRMHDATMFSVDVAVAKSRNVIYFSGPGYVDLPGIPQGTAVTNRTIGFGSQPLFPSGIDGTPPGPFYSGVFLNDVAHPCTQGSQPANANQSGVVFFPGSVPLYRNGILVGGLGVSGDGVDQDDYVAAGGAVNFQAPANIRADQVVINGVRMPYQKFPRNPTE